MREAYWRDVIRRQRVWDLSAAEFCDREGVSTASFYNWRKRLAEEDGSTPLFVPLDFRGDRLKIQYFDCDGQASGSRDVRVSTTGAGRRACGDSPRRPGDGLYEVERAFRDRPLADIVAGRQQYARPILKQLRTWLDRDPDAKWVIVVDCLNIHQSAGLVEWIASESEPDRPLGQKKDRVAC